MSIDCIKDANLEETGFNYTMSLIQGKYKMFILYALMGFQVVRFNELKKYIKNISYKTLSTTLKELEADGLVHREEYPQIPPKVEYSLTSGKITDTDFGQHVRVGRKEPEIKKGLTDFHQSVRPFLYKKNNKSDVTDTVNLLSNREFENQKVSVFKGLRALISTFCLFPLDTARSFLSRFAYRI